MGGQACVLYGAAEFSKNVDFALLATPENLDALQSALGELEARLIAVPPLEIAFLERGHAVHFRCARVDVEELRVDIMSRMRGVDDFVQVWERRTEFEADDGQTFAVLSIPDLIRAKKTQRTKDWPMIERLVLSHYFANKSEPTTARVQFWLTEARTPTILLAVSKRFPEVEVEREAAVLARDGADETQIEAALKAEEERKRAPDRAYWAPLKAELEQLRRERNREREA